MSSSDEEILRSSEALDGIVAERLAESHHKDDAGTTPGTEYIHKE